MGRWHEPNGSDITEFKADGNLLENPANADPIRGRYTLRGAELKVELEGVNDPLSFTVAIKGDLLEMTDAEGHKTQYRRA